MMHSFRPGPDNELWSPRSAWDKQVRIGGEARCHLEPCLVNAEL